MTSSSTAAQEGWRTVDIVVTAVLGVAFGVVFAGWNVLTSALFSGAGQSRRPTSSPACGWRRRCWPG